MYQDVNGKRGYRALLGASGKTYGNLKLFSQEELDAARADGIVDYVAPPPQPDSPQAVEHRRKRAIRGIAMGRVEYHLLGDLDDGETQLARTLLDLTLALTETVKDLVQAGVVTPAQLNQRIKDLNGLATDVKQARQAAVAAITNGDDLATFTAALDAIIPAPEGP